MDFVNSKFVGIHQDFAHSNPIDECLELLLNPVWHTKPYNENATMMMNSATFLKKC